MAVQTTNNGGNKTRAAKRAFYVTLVDMTWRMFAAMAVPVLLGSYLDKKFQTGEMFTAIGVFLSLIAAGLVIKYIVNKASAKVAK